MNQLIIAIILASLIIVSLPGKIHGQQPEDKTLVAAVKLIHEDSFDSAIYLLNQYLTTGKTKNNQFLYGIVNLNLGTAYYYKGDYDNSLKYYLEAKNFFEDINDTTQNLSKSYMNIGYVYKKIDEYDKAIDYFLKASMDFKDPSKDLAANYNGIGSLYGKLEKPDLAIEYYKKSLTMYQQIGFKRGAYKVYNNLGKIYTDLKAYDSAAINYETSLEYKISQNDSLGIATAYNNLGWMYLEKLDLDKAEEYLLMSYGMKLQINEKVNINKTMNQLGEVYLIKGDYSEAFDYLSGALEIAEENRLRKDKREILLNLSRYYELIGDTEQQVGVLKEYIITNDSLLNVAKLKTIHSTESQYKDRQITFLQRAEYTLRSRIASLGNYLAWTIAAIVLLSLAIAVAVIFIIKYRKSSLLNYQLKKENLHSIKNHLQTLSSILSMQHRELENLQAKEALKDSRNRLNAINLIHQLLYNEHSSGQKVSFDQYMRNLSDALKNSYETNLISVSYTVAKSEKLCHADFMLNVGLLLNELVTNAFKHGIKPGEHGKIRIRATIVENTSVFLEVRDNGEGLPDGQIQENETSFGSRLIDLLTKQLNAHKNIFNDNGAVFQFSVPFPR
ncbi:MAG: tetratricopeptide repeat protein [Cyclobacteriaceae bacterium]